MLTVVSSQYGCADCSVQYGCAYCSVQYGCADCSVQYGCADCSVQYGCAYCSVQSVVQDLSNREIKMLYSFIPTGSEVGASNLCLGFCSMCSVMLFHCSLATETSYSFVQCSFICICETHFDSCWGRKRNYSFCITRVEKPIV